MWWHSWLQYLSTYTDNNNNWWRLWCSNLRPSCYQTHPRSQCILRSSRVQHCSSAQVQVFTGKWTLSPSEDTSRNNLLLILWNGLWDKSLVLCSSSFCFNTNKVTGLITLMGYIYLFPCYHPQLKYRYSWQNAFQWWALPSVFALHPEIVKLGVLFYSTTLLLPATALSKWKCKLN